MNGKREMPSIPRRPSPPVIISGASWASFYTTTVYPSLASESTTADGSSCMTKVGWNLAEEGHSQPIQVDSMTLGQDPVISTLLVSVWVCSRSGCAAAFSCARCPTTRARRKRLHGKALDSTAAVASFVSPARSQGLT